ncbi:peptidase [Calidifontibacter sp. DB0510]|uniref:ATP-dependent Clp protease proteolytic subunit n=1 Tax=Metallococcus carri TaxID=1656884 RepID=A0A967B6U6_9MICO|nr:head maturation protease, ClpP-related [Metallococcus carri]NHN55781.1 peptidase [Metallococcus carri]NOP38530.1 peptidase [Calidifontibacter sp. DB2511S]
MTDQFPALPAAQLVVPSAKAVRAARANAKRMQPLRAEKASPTTARVYLYAEIGGWFGVLAEDFAAEVNALEVDQIHLHVNSPGGSAFDGLAMANVLRQHDAKVIAHVDGLAASAASLVILGADEIVMEPGSQLMVHDAWAACIGNAADMTKTASILDKLCTDMAGLYAVRAGGTPQEWRAVMLEETWYTATEAVDAGLADRVSADAPGGRQDAAAAAAAWDLSMFAHAPEPHTAAHSAPQSPAASATGSTPSAAAASGSEDTHDEGSTLMDLTESQVAALCNAVGVGVDADPDTIVAAVQEALTERAEQPEERPAAQDDETTVRVDRDMFDQLRADAALGRKAHEAQLRAARERTVDAAVSEGRIAPARRDAWLARLEADPEDEQQLARLEPVFNTTEHGHAGDIDLDGDTALAKQVGWADNEQEAS